MTLLELWNIAPRCHIFIRKDDGTVERYDGTRATGVRIIADVYATKYPMYDAVLEVKLEP